MGEAKEQDEGSRSPRVTTGNGEEPINEDAGAEKEAVRTWEIVQSRASCILVCRLAAASCT